MLRGGRGDGGGDGGLAVTTVFALLEGDDSGGTMVAEAGVQGEQGCLFRP